MLPRVTTLQRSALAWLGLVLGLTLASSKARAGNADELPVGNRAAMVGGAVMATVDDGSAAYYNPAGLGSVDRSSVDVSASAYSLRFYAAPGFLSTPEGSRDASVSEFVAIPTEIAYVRLLGEHLALGLGYYVPRASDFLLRESLDASGDSRRSRFALDMRVSTTEYLVAAALGSRIGERLRWGVAVFGSYEKATESAVLFASVDNLMDEPAQVIAISLLTTETIVGFELVGGVQLDLSDHVTIGLVARSPRLRAHRDVEDTIDLVSYDDSDVPLIEAERDESSSARENVSVVKLGRYGAGLAYRREAVTLSVEGDFQPGFSESKADIELAPTWNARVGMAFGLSDALVLGAGLFTDRSARRNDDTLPNVHADFYGATLGLEINNRHALAKDEAVDSIILSAVFALRYAYGVGETQTISYDPDSAGRLNAIDSSVQVHELGLHVGSALYF